MKLSSKQIAAIEKFVDELVIGPGGSFNAISWGDNEKYLRVPILSKSPWSDLLEGWHVAMLVSSEIEKIKPKFPPDYLGKLGAMKDRAIAGQMVKALVDFFESLPRTYYVYFHLPRFPRLSKSEVVLGDRLCLIDTATGFNDHIVYRNALRRGPPALPADTIFLRVTVTGYAVHDVERSAVAEAVSILKHFLFLGTRHGRIKGKGLQDHYADALSRVSTKGDCLVWNVNDVSDVIEVRLPDQLSDYLRWLSIEEKHLVIQDFSGGSAVTLLTAPTKPAVSPDEIDAALKMAFSWTLMFMKFSSHEKDAERVCAAMEWAIDADSNSNETIAFLQRCIGLEAILGTDDKSRGITERLSDRYAYLLGETQSMREKLKEEFKKVYGARSDLVHSRNPRIRPRHQFGYRASQMLTDVIWKEVNGLIRAHTNEGSRKPA